MPQESNITRVLFSPLNIYNYIQIGERQTVSYSEVQSKRKCPLVKTIQWMNECPY